MHPLYQMLYREFYSWYKPFNGQQCAALLLKKNEQCSRKPAECIGSYEWCKQHAAILRKRLEQEAKEGGI